MNLGNRLNKIQQEARRALFFQGEMVQLTYTAFDVTVSKFDETENEEIEIPIPIGYRDDRSPMTSQTKFTPAQLKMKYNYLASHQLSINGIVQLVIILEAMFNDILRAVVLEYPKKLGSKRNISIQSVLEANSIDEVQLRAADSLLHEISYKSPAEYSEFFAKIVGPNLLECLSFHRYVEIKATRDIFIHAQGVANDIYVRKAGTHARVNEGQRLTSDPQYYLESYEACHRITEWLEAKLHELWHSSDLEKLEKKQKEKSALENESPAI